MNKWKRFNKKMKFLIFSGTTKKAQTTGVFIVVDHLL